METYAYIVPQKTWTPKGLNGPVPPVSTTSVPQPAMAYNTATHKLYYHQTTPTSATDWVYDPVADMWVQVSATGVGATNWQALAYDAGRNVLVGWNQSWQTDLWQGILNAGAAPPPPLNLCDVNRDGIVNSLDVQVAISQALGITACNTADLIGNGICSVIDVQRVVIASLGGTCRTGQ
jgi:hypothetical protein